MMEWIISSSVLIAVMILLRYALRGKLDLRLQYALWAVVLLRLLIPVSFGQTSFSVLNAAPAEHFTTTTAGANLDQPAPLPAGSQGTEFAPPETGTAPVQSTSDPGAQGDTLLVQGLLLLWLTGVSGVGLCFGLSNLCFARSLGRSRKPVDTGGEGLSVYVTDAVDTPCLFGLFRPAIYVTPAALADLATLGHVLAHETTHFRHGDHLWALLRGICVALHWYNPLVWWAAVLSRRDGETACDEDTIRSLGEEERGSYGRTLLRMTCQRPSGLLTTATTMSGSARTLRERITLIAKKPNMRACTVVLLAAVLLVAAGCTFTGKAASQDIPIQHTLTAGQEIPQAAIDAADRLITQRITDYNKGWKDAAPGCSVAEAKLTGLIPIPTGVAALEDGMELFRVEYRLRVKGDIARAAGDSIKYETIDGEHWLTEEGLGGTPYLCLYWQDQNGTTTWEDAGAVHEISLSQYNTSELLEQYGSKYTAYAAERYNAYRSEKAGREEISVFLALSPTDDAPNQVLGYAQAVVSRQAKAYQQAWQEIGSDCTITEAKITGMTQIPTGVADLNGGLALYRLEYRLRVEGNIEEVLAGGASYETIDGANWLTEWTSAGQPYLLFHYQDAEQEGDWQPICVTNDDAFTQFTTDEAISLYGDIYTAAAAGLYAQYLQKTAQ